MSTCESPVIWGADGEVELRCEATKPCPYHDRNGLTDDQRREWRRTWAMKQMLDESVRRHYGTKP